MEIITWKDEIYSVGNREIDQQHKNLFFILNNLFNGMSKGMPKKDLGQILNELVQYIEYHFESEEKYFGAFHSYRMKKRHIDLHNSFREKIREFQKDFESGKRNLSIDIFLFIKNWIINHIKKTDITYCEFYKKHNQKISDSAKYKN